MALKHQIYNLPSRLLKSVRSANSEGESETPNLIDEKAPSPLAIIYRSELDYLSRCVLDYPDIETGGQLFGLWTSQGVPVVLYAIGPGRNANHQAAFFNQDSQYLSLVGNALLDRYGLCHIGEWHSHHQLGLAQPSSHDARTMHHGLEGIPQRRLLLCICNYENGCSTVNPYNFHENDLRGYASAQWQVKEMDSPFRKIVDRDLADMLIHPATQEPRHGRNRILEIQEEPKTPKIKIPAEYWLTKDGNIDTLKQMREYTQTMLNGAKVEAQANEEGIVQLCIADRELAFRFPMDFPSAPPVLYLRGNKIDKKASWTAPATSSEIFHSYQEWLCSLLPKTKC